LKLKELLAKIKEGFQVIGNPSSTPTLTTSGSPVDGKTSPEPAQQNSNPTIAAETMVKTVTDTAVAAKPTELDFSNLKSIHGRIKTALLEASKDGSITTDELKSLQELQAQLGITEDDMKKIRVETLQEVVKHVHAQKKITPEESHVIHALKSKLVDKDWAAFKGDLEKATALGGGK
jgi:hypothetical protein